ncbi:cache domain-containing protein [uncultured Brevibacillus sp.]|uniref:cache domain-containing protein n=1 Tax=uncultured Brevibacillus sp. TaxID=169970 RepID=UPI0025915834|nr:cache domain-containing protein [uncultured Brevibacillus sp.]
MPVLQRKKKQWNKISLVTLLTGLVSISVALTVTILLISSYQSKKQALINTTLTLNHTSAIKMSHTIDSLIKSMRSSLHYSANLFSKTMSAEEGYSKLELIRHTNNYFNSITVVDETGLVRYVSPASVGTAGKYITTETAKAALAAKKPYISKSYLTVNTKRLIVLISEPIFDTDGIYRGVIAGTIYLHENNILNTIFGSPPTDELDSSFYIVGSDGHLLFHRETSRIGEDISENHAVRKLIQGKSGYEQLNRHLASILLYMLAPFLLLMLVVIWLAHRVARPFVSLADLVSKAGREE